MGKRAAYYEEAMRLFTQQGKTLAEIAAMLPVSTRSLAKWSTEGNWPKRRMEYLSSEQHFTDILNELKLKLALQAQEDPDPQNIYALCRIVAVLKPAAAVELRRLEKEEKENATLTAEEKLARIQEALSSVYGIQI